MEKIKNTAKGMVVGAKGVLCKEDAKLALEYGCDFIYVSDHGCRQLDTTPTTLEVLPEIVREVRLHEK